MGYGHILREAAHKQPQAGYRDDETTELKGSVGSVESRKEDFHVDGVNSVFWGLGRGFWFISGGDDGAIRIWDAHNGRYRPIAVMRFQGMPRVSPQVLVIFHMPTSVISKTSDGSGLSGLSIYQAKVVCFARRIPCSSLCYAFYSIFIILKYDTLS